MKLFMACGVLYLLSGLWCLFQSQQAAAGVGYQFTSSFGESEFIVVYGGLQLGLGLAMVICARLPLLVMGALVFSLIFSAVLTLFRLGTFFFYGASGLWVLLFLVELSIVIALFFAVRDVRSDRVVSES